MKNNLDFYPTVLTIAGSDTCGGAGIQADLRTFSAFGVYGYSIITALTAQNHNTITEAFPTPKDILSKQLDAIIDFYNISTIKTGMLVNFDILNLVYQKLKDKKVNLIVDRVMICTSGSELLDKQAIEFLQDKFLHLATWITPNIPEAEVLIGEKIQTQDDIIQATKLISSKWDCNTVIKGGHLKNLGDTITDIVCYNKKIYSLETPVIKDTQAGHGTGCTFASALAASFAINMKALDALSSAKSFVYGSLAEAVILKDNVEAMYPPENAYKAKIKEL